MLRAAALGCIVKAMRWDPMKYVAFLSDAFAKRNRYGLSRYAWELFDAVRARQDDITLVPCSTKCDWSQQEHEQVTREYGYRHVGWGRKAMALLWSTVRLPKLEKWLPKTQIVHSVELSYPVATDKPWVVTIHDLGPLTHPEYFSSSRPWLLRKAIQHVARHSTRVIAVSYATAEAIEEVAGPAIRDRVVVIPEGVHERFFQPASSTHLEDLRDLPESGTPYLLWTGSINPRKNLRNVLTAFERVADSIPHHLVLAGGLGWESEEVIQSIARSAVRHRIHRPGYVTDAQLQALYQGAAGFLYISLMEGFGLPILEAMASGCPVVTSNISSMPEVAGDAAIFVDPFNPEHIAEGMAQVARQDAPRDALISRGKRRAREFDWARSAEALVNVYKSS